MSDLNNEREIAEKEGGLENLPESDQKETKEILDDIEREEGDKPESGDDKPEKPEEKPEEKPKKEKSDEGDDKGDDKGDDGKPKDKKEGDDDKEPPRSKTKLIPSWVHERAKEDWGKEKEELNKQIEDLSKGKEGHEEKPSAEKQEELEKEVESLAEEHNLDPKLVKSLVGLGMKFGGKIPEEVQEKLKHVDELRESAEVEKEQIAFEKSFDKYVLPEIKKEYGDNVSEDTISTIKEKMKERAYSEEFKQTPYSVIYKGVDEFREFKRPSGPAEEGRGGFESKGDAGKGEELDFSNVTDDDIEKMDGETFDKYSKWQEDQERKKSLSSS